jgi:hypothetical protein
MSGSDWLVVVSAGIPLAWAVRANRSTSLFHAVLWAVVAWGGWVLSALTGGASERYLALALTGCAGVAVLGARRPGIVAWNFVIVGLLVVLLLPLGEAHILGTPLRLGTFRTVFLASLLGVTVINYLPTRLGVGAALLGVGCGLALARLTDDLPQSELEVWSVGLAPWLGWLGLVAGRQRVTPADVLWRALRDRYGLVWGQRVREQFNRAAANAGLACELRWTGLRPPGDVAARDLLEATVKRFLDSCS